MLVSRNGKRTPPWSAVTCHRFGKCLSCQDRWPTERFRHVGHRVSHHGHRRDAELELAWVHFVERVGRRVMNVEIMCAVHIQTRAHHAFTHDWTNVRSTTSRRNLIGADSR